MAGIISFGAYIPVYRLDRKLLSDVWGIGGRGEKAVANCDEDSLTLGVEAGLDCLRGLKRDDIDALFFASTTPPYREKLSASIIAPALDLREDIFTADFTDSLRAGSMALRAAFDAVRAKSARKVLVIVSDTRLPAPASEYEALFGDGASAFLIGEEDVACELLETSFLSSEFMDYWRREERFVLAWEDRFMNIEGYQNHMVRVLKPILKRNEGVSRVVYYAHDNRTHGMLARSLGIPREKLEEPIFDSVGNTGASLSFLMLTKALETAKAGDRIIFANYGDGADAWVFEVREPIEDVRRRIKGFSKHLSSKLMLENYGKYIKFRSLMEFMPSLEYRLRTSLPLLWRDRKDVLRLYAQRCRKCGRLQYPSQKVCMWCQAIGEFDEERIAEREGTLFTYSIDERAPVIDPPNVLAVADLDGGVRFFSHMTDRDTKRLEVGMPVELTFRRYHEALRIYNYFWKIRPRRG